MSKLNLIIDVAECTNCNLCTLGVHQCELDGKPRHMLGIFIGTGIGGGIIIDGRLYSGFSRAAGEIGHMGIIGRKHAPTLPVPQRRRNPGLNP